MCTLTGDIAKLAILKHARIVQQKNIFNERLQHVHKISTHHKEQGFQTGDARKHSRRFKTAYRFLSCNKSVLFSVAQCQFFSAVTL